MNGLTLYLLVFLPIVAFAWGKYLGYAEGSRDGRIATRKYYEKVMNVR